ncbi:MAG: pyrimidine 5'-nucleotidase [Thermodesulfobacteriota bacterium]|nr:pyrimidine 5'-nucleotidase [Thermodesulfobacteriota bacterium]
MKTILLDVDDTLYPKGTGPFKEVSKKIEEYVVNECELNIEDARNLRKEYIIQYGSTLGGLMRHHGVDPEKFLRDVHDVPVEEMLNPDARLKKILSEIPYRLTIFSNASKDYVNRILHCLDISDVFDDLFTIEYMDFIPKPKPYPYYKILELYDMKPGDFIIVDDRVPNIDTAIAVGMKGIVVGGHGHLNGALCIPDIYGIADVID